MAVIKEKRGAAHTRILGVGGYTPSRVVTNEEVCTWIDSSDEWIRTRSGIETRRWATPAETVLEMSVHAAGKALAAAGVSGDQLGAVIVATVSHMHQTPALACLIADRLGTNGAAYDVSAGCAGFCYGVAQASDMVKAGSAEYVLVVGVERLSDLTDIHDRGTAFIFGDGAGAVVIGPSDVPGIGPVVWGSEGDKYGAITQTFAWNEAPEPESEAEDGAVRGPFLQMEGQAVFRWASYQMAEVSVKALEAAGITAADLEAFIPHQANMRITDRLVKVLGLPEHVPVARTIAEFGNNSAATIPMAMERMLEDGSAPHGGLALLIGFGAGLVYAAQVVTLP
ncbi:ketoacyl-ACP synthase III [Catenulispora yoronensis]|uniref:Beta-ketoacyl-[acyl-carrier-protein] synthase III n=1 Tax=Catenulispora yoronensis TaxID=450799 RepID=A0ABN2VE15_9ACTN